MLFTNYILRNTCDISEMTKEDFEYFNKFLTDTEGQELYYLSGEEYIGEYHIHPTIGPMEGATHIDESHKKLYYS